jgi:hypothetical protein
LPFGKAENFAGFDSAIVPRWATNPNYEKNTLHFSQRIASRSVRTENRRGRTDLAGTCQDRAQHHRRKSAGDD